MAETDALSILKKRYGDLPGFSEGFADERLNVRVAMMIYEARKDAGLSQSELARMIDSTQQVVSQLEDADYEGHSLSMLQRIATALNRRVEINMPKLEQVETA